ncbi:peptide chain release factor 2 [bacterium]|nr:peptide chain release factor 2 [bacterium]
MLEHMRDYLDPAGKEQRLFELEQQQSRPDFWDDQAQAAAVSREAASLSAQLEQIRSAEKGISDIQTMWELLQEEGVSEDSREQLDFERELRQLATLLEGLEIETLLAGEYDEQPAIVSIQAGAGGRESADWGEMLYRMYKMFSDRQGWKLEVTDETEGEGGGIQSLTFRVEGRHAYGFMRMEHGVHRLVRISPFDRSARRHTSFASVSVIPETPAELDIELKDEDVKMDVYRSSGAGGQHVNKTSSAVRLTHLPTGIVVSCQNQRSQHQNRDVALRELKSRILAMMLEQHKERVEDLRGVQTEISWGNQIRNYVLQPYQLVKDTRTGFETSDTNGVLNGNIEPLIWACLRWMRSSASSEPA